MTDRELLEAAAKSAGIEWTPSITDWGGLLLPGGGVWRPLTDDGDALRLAVKCGIHITNSITDAWASTLLTDATEPRNGDLYAATRRCIVRAAAASIEASGDMRGSDRE